jgi:all-trans-retinol 13,14-reductase
MAVRDELSRLPDTLQKRDFVSGPFRFPRLLRYRTWSLQRYYDHVGMPSRLQAILAGQSGDYLLPPETVSFLLHASLVINYDRGAYYPEKHYSHLVDSITDVIRNRSGCDVLLEHEVEEIIAENGRVIGVRSKNGHTFRASRYVSNVDPARTLELTRTRWPRACASRLEYEFSSSTFTIYLGIRDLDLRDFGFGSYNVWHYPHEDLNEIYRTQLEDHDLSNPWLFLSTPTLHSDAPGIAPPGHHILEIATSCDYDHFAALRRQGRRAYSKAKIKIRNRILEIVEDQYIPGLRKHNAMRLAGTPLTNERYCWAPRGNAYGSILSADAAWPRTDFRTPLDNLYLVNASAGFPSVSGTVGSGLRLFDRLQA